MIDDGWPACPDKRTTSNRADSITGALCGGENDGVSTEYGYEMGLILLYTLGQPSSSMNDGVPIRPTVSTEERRYGVNSYNGRAGETTPVRQSLAGPQDFLVGGTRGLPLLTDRGRRLETRAQN